MTNPAAPTRDSQYPPGSFVEVYSIGKGAKKSLLARCTLQADGAVSCVGETNFVRQLTAGVYLSYQPKPKTFTPSDGLAFLQALQGAYRDAYITATDIQMPLED